MVKSLTESDIWVKPVLEKQSQQLPDELKALEINLVNVSLVLEPTVLIAPVHAMPVHSFPYQFMKKNRIG